MYGTHLTFCISALKQSSLAHLLLFMSSLRTLESCKDISIAAQQYLMIHKVSIKHFVLAIIFLLFFDNLILINDYKYALSKSINFVIHGVCSHAFT